MAEPAAKRARGVGDSATPITPVHELGRTVHMPGMVIREHTFTVPLDYSAASSFSNQTITLFVREILSPARNETLPFMVYLQGGPGFEAPRVTEPYAWIKPALSSHRVLLLDQRGTGRSAPITTTNLAKRGSAEQQAEYLSLFRADSIVRDCETIRKLMVPPTCYGGKWSILGQSFGGFCAVTYLSMAPEGLMECLITGGLPPGVAVPCSAEAVYTALHKRVILANKRYYERFPGDIPLVQRIVTYLAAQPGGYAPLPSGSHLTPRMLQTLGLSGLGSGGGFERLHYLLESFFDAEGEMTPAFAKLFESWHSWDSNPLYALVHEAIYCQSLPPGWAVPLDVADPIEALAYLPGPGPAAAAAGSFAGGAGAAGAPADGAAGGGVGEGGAGGGGGGGSSCASRWAADRVRDAHFGAAFDAVAAAREGRPVLFTGECVYRFMFDDVAALRPFKPAADALAAKADWGPLYHPAVLRTNRVPTAALAYLEDLYVDYNMSRETARYINGIKVWATNEYRHSGIRDDGGRIFDRLLNLVRNATFD